MANHAHLRIFRKLAFPSKLENFFPPTPQFFSIVSPFSLCDNKREIDSSVSRTCVRVFAPFAPLTSANLKFRKSWTLKSRHVVDNESSPRRPERKAILLREILTCAQIYPWWKFDRDARTLSVIYPNWMYDRICDMSFLRLWRESNCS